MAIMLWNLFLGLVKLSTFLDVFHKETFLYDSFHIEPDLQQAFFLDLSSRLILN